jgi:hypothetical protein
LIITYASQGDVTLTLSTAKHGVVGNSSIPNMTLRPGNNTLPMTAIIDQLMVTDSMNTKTGIVELLIKGNSSIRNGQHLTYYVSFLLSIHNHSGIPSEAKNAADGQTGTSISEQQPHTRDERPAGPGR